MIIIRKADQGDVKGRAVYGTDYGEMYNKAFLGSILRVA